MKCLLAALLLLGLSSIASAEAPAVRSITLPDASASGVLMDYLAYDRAHHRVWVPAGNTGNVDVVDVASGEVTKIGGFATSEMERNGKKRTVGPSSATVGGGMVYVGNRGDSGVCAIAADTLRKGECVKLDSMPDGLAYVGSTKEVWATTPRDRSITIIDVAEPGALKVKGKISLEGAPEGFVVDDGRGLFYTNLEDKDRTLAIEIRSRKVAQTWLPNCGADGPKGLALDRSANFLFVACSDRLKVLDAGHHGKELASMKTGAGVDNIDYVDARHEIYIAAAHAANLIVARVDSRGKVGSETTVVTATGARNPVVTDDGTAYLTDSPEGKLLIIPPIRRR